MTTPFAITALARWGLASSFRIPLDLLRMLVGLAALRFAWLLDARWSGSGAYPTVLDTSLVADGVPDVLTSILRLPIIERHPDALQIALLAASCGFIMGWFTRTSGALLWIAVLSFCRATYPLTRTTDELLAWLLLWSLLLAPAGPLSVDGRIKPERAGSSRAGVCGFLLFLTGAALSGEPFEPVAIAAIGTAGVLGLAALTLGATPPPARRTVDAGMVLCAMALLVQPGRALATGLGLGRHAEVLTNFAWDIGLLPTSRGAIGPHPMQARTRAVPDRASATVVWPELSDLGPAWTYLASDHRPLDETDLNHARVRAAVRQGVADRACRTAASSTIIDVFGAEDPSHVLLSFYCVEGSARLVPPPAAALETFAERRAPLSELVRLAQLRTARREFAEALHLLELAARKATAAQRNRARLDERAAAVRKLAGAGSARHQPPPPRTR